MRSNLESQIFYRIPLLGMISTIKILGVDLWGIGLFRCHILHDFCINNFVQLVDNLASVQ